MKHALVLLLLLAGAYYAFALSDGEKTALDAIRSSFVALSTASPPWTSNISEACNPPTFYGLNCSSGADPHVTSLYVALFFGALSFCKF